jgi:predicted secreted hydrolase
LAGAAVSGTAGDFDVRVDRWFLRRNVRSGVFHAHVAAADFSLELEITPQQTELLQGSDEKTAGYSRKGPNPLQASYYYSLPHLAVSGMVRHGGRAEAFQGSAWLDHEWSTAYLDPRAAGWDWMGLNFDDGSALMAFRIREKQAAGTESKTLWAGGTLRRSDGAVERYSPGELHFETLRSWTSPRTGTRYPVEQRISIEHAGMRHGWRLSPLFDDQELDSRASTGTIYWEGAVRALGEGEASVSPAGRGYLELTGYQQPLKF